MIVVDASVLVTALADDGADGDRVRQRIRGERLVAPHLVDVEVISAWRRLAAGGGLDDRRAELAIVDLRSLQMERVPHGPLLGRCWQLCENVTPYDALYVALAEATGTTLLTADAKLAAAPGAMCPVELLD